MENPSIVVCVTDQQSCVRLIHAGHTLSDNSGCELHVLSVLPASTNVNVKGDALEYLFTASRQAGADMSVFYNDDPITTIIDYVQAKNASTLVLGEGPKRSGGFLDLILDKCPCPINVITKTGDSLYITPQRG